MATAADPVARRDITLLRARIAELEGRATPVLLAQGEAFTAVVTAVAAEFGVTRDQLLGESRVGQVVLARQVAMALGHRLLGYSLPRLGRLTRRDHTTVLHGCRRVARLAERDPDFAARLDALAARIRNRGITT